MNQRITLAALSLAGVNLSQAHAQTSDITLEIEIPQLEVAEYHRPYVAAWIEGEDKQLISDVLVWYQTEVRNPGGEHGDHGEKWLKDLRKWWRISGRNLNLPIDGLSSPTRPPGKHQINLTETIKKLPQGSYKLHVEAAREVGGRELLAIPFTWDGTTLKAEPVKGSTELGAITLN